MSKITIIGKGFVGKNLLDQYNKFECEVFDSKNINFINQKEHNTILCAAPSGKKWLVNKNKEIDLNNILSLIELLKNTKFKKLILFSTIDVYNNNCVIFDEKSNNFNDEPYGKNRKVFEEELQNISESVYVIRLPALFGNYLEKNYIYDLLNNNMINKIKLNSSFQWYPIKKLYEHVEFVLENDIKLLNLAAEPINTELIVNSFFQHYNNIVDSNTEGIFYDMRSSYGKDGYIINRNDVWNELEKYIKNARNNY